MLTEATGAVPMERPAFDIELHAPRPIYRHAWETPIISRGLRFGDRALLWLANRRRLADGSGLADRRAIQTPCAKQAGQRKPDGEHGERIRDGFRPLVRQEPEAHENQ